MNFLASSEKGSASLAAPAEAEAPLAGRGQRIWDETRRRDKKRQEKVRKDKNRQEKLRRDKKKE